MLPAWHVLKLVCASHFFTHRCQTSVGFSWAGEASEKTGKLQASGGGDAGKDSTGDTFSALTSWGDGNEPIRGVVLI